MPRKLTASISLGAMRHNLRRVRQQAPSSRVWAVVKADAYGHGLLNALQGFAEADGMALLEFEGAARLREHGWQKPILMLEGPFDADDVAQAAAQGLTLAVGQGAHLQWLAGHSRADRPLSVWLKINTGLNRLGVKPEDLGVFVRQLLATPGVQLQGCMTHFANADVPGGADAALATFDHAMAMVEQLIRHDANQRASGAPHGEIAPSRSETKTTGSQPATETPAGQGTRPPVPSAHPAPACHTATAAGLQQSVANSATLFSEPDALRDWIRPGIALYGATPFADIDARELGLEPVMRLHGSILAVQQMNPGEATGYGSRFVARRPTRIGIVDCGYADGYPRVAPTGTPVLVNGTRTRLLGRVSMDMLAVDLNPVPEAGPGAPVELWGEHIPVDEVAALSGTIGYELLCAITPRVRREVIE
ncbi:MAG: alanine racemase [Lautropia sp.]|nr:alanine racemase [Lautropia sp.]